MSKKTKQNNLVAKHMNTFNVAKTFVDRNKESKRGYIKHKGKGFDSSY